MSDSRPPKDKVHQVSQTQEPLSNAFLAGEKEKIQLDEANRFLVLRDDWSHRVGVARLQPLSMAGS